ncbi:glycosyl hydrolase family 43 [Enterococcus sp. OL5]|nr:glycosyl hydrolase family 43 [Enterococcus sp. OL5]
MILKHENMYYWYGENKEGPNVKSATDGRKVDFIGISCYSSSNLRDWHYEGLVLEASNDPSNPLYRDKVVERPKVVYSKWTKEFVLWFHYDHDDYWIAASGVATSKTPTGSFELNKIFKPNRKDSRDFTIFEDEDKFYLVHSSDFNKTMYISELTDDLTDVTGLYTKILVDQEREAPAVFKKNGMYFMVTSGTTGWEPNAALYSRSNHLFTPHKLIDNPCEGQDYRYTFHGQFNYAFEVKGNVYIMIDHWKPDNLRDSGYSILPVEIIGKKKRDLRIKWTEEPFGGELV